MKRNVYKVNAFAKTKEGGNPAGVVLNADALSEIEMKKIARLLGFSETAFVMQSRAADYRLRFFTPNAEVDLCGHATIGTFSVMASLELIKCGTYTQETNAGILQIEVCKDHSIMMHQTATLFTEIVKKEELADSLNLKIDDILEELPAQVVSTGLRDIIIPVRSVDTLNAMQPDFEKIQKISQNYKTVGYHVFALETLQGITASCRNFAPLYDIPEEAATGTSSGALGCYLYHYGKVDKEQALNMIFKQGYSMNRPSEIRVSLVTKENEIVEVKVQ